MNSREAQLEAPRRILVINVSRIGDTLLVTPALRALAKAWPRAELTFLGHPKRVEVIENLPFVAVVDPISKHRARWRGWLAGKRWDLALVYGFDRPLLAYALRVARRVVAFRQGDPALDERLFRCVERPPAMTQHATDSLLALTRAIGVPDASHRLAYSVTDEEQEWARSRLAGKLPADAKPLVGLQMASFPTKGYRDWPLESFVALGEHIVGRWPNAHFLLFGGSPDRERAEMFSKQLSGKATAFAGMLTLRQSAALMNELDLYIGVDTGPTHIMGALSAPMVALYHCYSPSRLLMPLERPRCHVVDHPRAAQGCTTETPMGEITVDAVWAKVLEALLAA